MNKISVIIPTFNRAWCLQRAISSVLSQSYSNYEIIVIDDCSTDDTEELIKSYGDKIIYKKLDKNFGVNYARNKGFDISQGDILVFLDSDDELLPDALKTIDDDFCKYEDVSLIAYNCIDSVTNLSTSNVEKSDYGNYYDFICGKIQGELFQVVKSEVMKTQLFPEFVNGVESLFWFEIWKNYKTYISTIPLRIYHTETTGSIMKSTSRNKALSFGLARERLIQNFGKDMSAKCPAMFSKLLYITGLELSMGGKKDKGIFYLKQSYAIYQNKKTLFVLTFAKIFNSNILRFLFSLKRSLSKKKSEKFTGINKPLHLIYLMGNLGAGGAEKLVCDLAIGLDKSKFRVSVIALGNYKDKEFEKARIEFLRQNGVEVKIIPKKPHKDMLKTLKTLRKILKMDSPDIIHAHLFTGIFYGAISSIGIKTHMVITYHNTSGFGIKDKIISFLFSKKIERVISVSDSVKDFVRNYFKIPDRKLITIYNGVDTKRFFKDKKNNDSDFILFGCLGRIVKQKGYDYLINALSTLEMERLKKIKIKIAGEGSLKEEMEKMVKENNLKDHVEFIGNVIDVPGFLSSVDVFVAPSIYEGFGISLIEAMAAGKPILVSDLDVFKEILGLKGLAYQNGCSLVDYGVMFKTGDVISLSNAIRCMLDNENRWKEFGENVRQRAKLFDISKTIEEHQNFYIEILKGASK